MGRDSQRQITLVGNDRFLGSISCGKSGPISGKVGDVPNEKTSAQDAGLSAAGLSASMA